MQPSIEDKDPFTKAIGPLGRWQIFIVSIIFPIKLPVAWHQMAIVFLAPPVKFACITRHGENTTLEFNSICYDDCEQYIFDKTIFSETIVTQWNLICKRRYLKDLTQTIFMLGVLVGSIVFGHLADRFGRRKPFLGIIVLQIVSGVATAYSPNYYIFNILRFFQAISIGGSMVGSFVIIMEITGAKYRQIIGIVYHIPFVLGLLTLPLVSYFARSWKSFQLGISLPSLLLLNYFWLIPESARWLITKGRTAEAAKIMEKAAKRNGLPYLNMDAQVQNIFKWMSVANPNKRTSLIDLFRHPRLRCQTCCISFAWLAVSFCFYGVTQYIGQATGNIFTNFAFAAVLQLPATFLTIYLLTKMGRKTTLISTFCVGGVGCLLISFVPINMSWMRIGLSILGAMSFSSVFANVYLYSSELFPTVVRNIGVGFCSTMARVGAMAAPFVDSLDRIQHWLPPVIFGLMPVIACILCTFLPETKGRKLPDTLDDI